MRARNIKPGFFLNEKLAEVNYETRLLFIGLWCYADSEGRFEWIPKRIEAAIFPYDKKIDIEKCLCNLMSLHLITSYTHGETKVGYIENFKKHQRPHPHEAKSTLPDKPIISTCEQTPPLHVMTCNDKILQCQPDVRMLGCSDIKNEDTPIPETSLAFLWNTVCVKLPKVLTVNQKRKNQEKIRLSEMPIGKWREVFTKINSSDFLCGGSGGSFKATYDWIMSNTGNAVKVLEGNYSKQEEVKLSYDELNRQRVERMISEGRL